MPRPYTRFIGQWADLPFEEVARLASGWGLVSAGRGDFPWEASFRERSYAPGNGGRGHAKTRPPA